VGTPDDACGFGTRRAGAEALLAAARQQLADSQQELDLGLDAGLAAAAGPGPLQITSTRMGLLWDALSSAYDMLGFGRAAGGDEVFRQLVLARLWAAVGCCGLNAPCRRRRAQAGRPGRRAGRARSGEC
jgi:hypothetical protein